MRPPLISDVVQLTGAARQSLFALAAAGIGTGALNTALVALASESLRGRLEDARMAGAATFVLLTACSLALQRWGNLRAMRLAEEATAGLRLRVLDRLFDAPLAATERLDRHAVRLVLARDTVTVADTLPMAAALMSSLATALCALAYLSSLAPAIGVAVCGVVGLSVVVFWRLDAASRPMIREALAANDRAFGFVDDLLQGARDLKLDADWAAEFRRNDLHTSIEQAAQRARKARVRLQDHSLIGLLAFQTLLCLVAFVQPGVGLPQESLLRAVVVLLFMQAHVVGVVQRLPALQEAAQSVQRIEALLERLPSGAASAATALADMPPWQTIRLRGVGYSYALDEGTQRLQLRDVNLDIRRGSLVFIVGGNGSGKTTLAKLITGLYTPAKGSVWLDDRPVDANAQAAYRGLFNAVFTDVHLFRRPLGTAAADPAHPLRRSLQEMAILMQLGEDQRLDTRPYSQGQRKRVASAMAVLSDRPVLMFDEWTADQDPEFRAYFYDLYLPRLKAAGKTVIVITHDDRYFHRADQLVRMDRGTVASLVNGMPA